MNPAVVIRAEKLGKKYVIGHESQRERYNALRDAISRSARSAFRTAADVLKGSPRLGNDTTEEFWALKDVNFEIRAGEVVGIIGRNGAGKSTLLKILSRITQPTEGRVTIYGRVGSLLEVGTGFHPELTGRENIYLNGAILGMRRAEVRRKFDEIVAFAEVEKFLDTPVKRYSSGMHVRLAFAVAAHLEPEILLVDEVLAVGDAEFQRKSLGKMNDVANGGRTVFFVSHNLGAIRSLCSRAFLFEGGKLAFAGNVGETLAAYERSYRSSGGLIANATFHGPIAGQIRFNQIVFMQNESAPGVLNPHCETDIELHGLALKHFSTFELKIALFRDGLFVASCHDTVDAAPLDAGYFVSKFSIPQNVFRPGMYTLGIGARDSNNSWVWGSDVAALHFSEVTDGRSDDRYEGFVGVPYKAQRIQRNILPEEKVAAPQL